MNKITVQYKNNKKLGIIDLDWKVFLIFISLAKYDIIIISGLSVSLNLNCVPKNNCD